MGAIKSDGHKYGEEWKTDANYHWKECACGDKASVAAHIDDNGDNKCDTCDYTMPAHDPDTPDQSDNSDTPPVDNPTSNDEGGLGAGIIVAIILVVVVVLGIGGFSVYWFVIKKKNKGDI